MAVPTLSSFCARAFARLRRGLAALGRWIQARPRLAAWFYPRDDVVDEGYHVHNGQMFANLHEQERMLADQPRMAFYHAAISRHIRPGDRVIDLGTGTGILAALASRQGAAHVYAIDHSRILEHARALAAANQLERVEFVGAHSSTFAPPEPVDVILHEQIGDCLFDEEMVTNITDLRDRVLKPGGRILPALFDLYCEPISILPNRVVPFIWELQVHGYDYSSLGAERPQDPGYYHLASSDRQLISHFLGQPEPVISVDLHTVNEVQMPRELTFTRVVQRAGSLDGLAVYFRARVDADLTLTSSPLDPGRAPHWGYRILRTEQEHYAVGDRIEVRLKVARWPDLDTWRWSTLRHPAAAPTQEPTANHTSAERGMQKVD